MEINLDEVLFSLGTERENILKAQEIHPDNQEQMMEVASDFITKKYKEQGKRAAYFEATEDQLKDDISKMVEEYLEKEGQTTGYKQEVKDFVFEVLKFFDKNKDKTHVEKLEEQRENEKEQGRGIS